MTRPAIVAMTRPESTYKAAIFQPNRPNSITRATSLMVGAAMRKENVTPRGMPLSTKPMNRGTAEQEQKGVTMPSMEARMFPIPCLFPPSRARVRSGLKKVRIMEMRKIMPESNNRILGTSYKKKAIDSPRWDPVCSWNKE